ncbi:hypothetical protein SSX86_002324 [Deinandra increscens subsp. villosa]|uniref:Retrovirus-related Pol polyprotein from transposon TNT 1-94 n=1 Tax=Deinandra increscens subsp. villosa TaxID=3103831 RepID=A0AAP0HB57_9ASTR
MRTFLVHQGVDDALLGEDHKPKGVEDKDWKSTLTKAHSSIVLNLGDRVLKEVSKETTAACIWLKLEPLYMTKSLANRLYLKKQLYTFHMSQGKSMTDHIDEFIKLVLDLENIDIKLDDEDKTLIFLTSLPQFYEHFVDTLLYGRESLTLDEVMISVNSKELKKKSDPKEEGGEGLVVRGRPESRSFKGDNRSYKVLGSGSVSFKLNNGVEIEIKEVRYVPGLKRSLMSLGTFEREGYHVSLKNGKARVVKGSIVMLSGIGKDNNIYLLDGEVQCGQVNVVANDTTSQAIIWHKRLGHISSQGLSELNKQSPSSAIQMQTPMELWTGKKPVLWKLNDESPKVFVSKDVVFNENTVYRDVKRKKQTTSIQTKASSSSDMRRQIEVEFEDNSTGSSDPLVVEDSEESEDEEAIQAVNKGKWIQAMNEEMESLYKNLTWVLVENPKHQKLVSCKWLYKVKEGVKEEIDAVKKLLMQEFEMKELAHFNLSCEDSPKTEAEVIEMSKVPYANVVGSLMYLMVCSRPDLGYVKLNTLLSQRQLKRHCGLKVCIRDAVAGSSPVDIGIDFEYVCWIDRA